MDIIIATDLDGGIGQDGRIPWKNSDDMTFFRETTRNSVVLMGRKTWHSIPMIFKPLKNRTNIVVSSRLETEHGSHIVVRTPEEGYALAEKIALASDTTAFCIGGPSLWEGVWDLLPRYVYLSTIKGSYDCDISLDDCPRLDWLINGCREDKDRVTVLKDNEDLSIIRMEV